MTRFLLLLCLISVFALAWMWSRPDPWASADQKGAEDALALSGLSQRYDQIGFYLSKDPALAKAVLWATDGPVLYPPGNELVPVQLSLSDDALRAIATIKGAASAPHWTHYDPDGDQLLYCRSAPMVCLIYHRAALETALNLPTEALNAHRIARPWATVFAASVLFGCAALLWKINVHKARSGDLQLIPERHLARRGNLEVPLTPRDLKLLHLLKTRDGRVVTKVELYDIGWGRDYTPNSRALDQHIINLRRKLDPDKSRPVLIESIRGVGYRMVL